MNCPANAISFADVRQTFQFSYATAPGWLPWNPNPISWTNGTFPAIRCDNVINTTKGACVFTGFVPVQRLIQVNNPAVTLATQFYKRAQQQLPQHWGVPGHFMMNRLMDPAQQELNRQVACKGFIHNPPTVAGPDSCDEFPFASTMQGAWFQSSYMVEHVPSAQNSTAGTYMNIFYSHENLINGDAFWLVIT